MQVTGRVLPMPPASEAAGIFARAGSSGSGPFAGVGSTHTSFDGSGPAPGAQGAAGDKGSGAGRASEGGAGLAGASAPKFSSAGSLGRSFQGTLAELRSALVALAHETSALGKLVAIYRWVMSCPAGLDLRMVFLGGRGVHHSHAAAAFRRE